MSDTQNKFDRTVNGYLEPLNNEYFKAALALFLILYAGVIAPRLPSSIIKLFDNFLVKIAVFFAIVWISKKDPTVAIIASIAVLVTLMIANNQLTIQNVADQVKKESFCGCGLPATRNVMENNLVMRTNYEPLREPTNPREIQGWYHEEQESDENETYYENSHSDKENVYNDRGDTRGKINTDPYYPDHEVQITKVTSPPSTTAMPTTAMPTTAMPTTAMPTTVVPIVTRLPLIDPEYPDHTHRMPTKAPVLVTNSGKINVEPTHPDHRTTANKKEHRILNSYVEPTQSNRPDDRMDDDTDEGQCDDQQSDDRDRVIIGYDDHVDSDSHYLV